MNQMGGGLTGDPRTIGLTAAVRACQLSLLIHVSDERTARQSGRSLIAVDRRCCGRARVAFAA